MTWKDLYIFLQNNLDKLNMNDKIGVYNRTTGETIKPVDLIQFDDDTIREWFITF